MEYSAGVLYKTLFFCNQVNGGDEWWTCRYNQKTGGYVPFESVSFMAVIREGRFEELVNDMLTATTEECMELRYKGKGRAKGGMEGRWDFRHGRSLSPP